ncbi:hotdog domain-containing protein [Microbulbifer halophilus]
MSEGKTAMSEILPRFDTLSTDDSASVTRVFDRRALEDWRRLADIGEDGPAVPEPLIAGLFSYLLGEQLPGHGTNYLKQHMRFHAPARVDEPLTATVTVTRLRRDKALVNLDTRCTGEGGRLICDGDALVLFQC